MANQSALNARLRQHKIFRLEMVVVFYSQTGWKPESANETERENCLKDERIFCNFVQILCRQPILVAAIFADFIWFEIIEQLKY